MEVDQAPNTLRDHSICTHRQAQRGQGIQQPRMGVRNRPALHLAQTIGKEAQRALGGDAGVELAQRAGGGVARVHKGLAALLTLALVQALEGVAPHIDLAAHLQHRRRAAIQPQRDLADGADVLRDVLAGLAVAARGGLHQHALLIAQVHGQAVELQLGRVFDLCIRQVQPKLAPHPGVKGLGPGCRGVGLGMNRQHGHRMAHRRQFGQGGGAHAQGRAVGAAQRRVGRLQRQPAPDTGGRTRRRESQARPACSRRGRGGATGHAAGPRARQRPGRARTDRDSTWRRILPESGRPSHRKVGPTWVASRPRNPDCAVPSVAARSRRRPGLRPSASPSSGGR